MVSDHVFYMPRLFGQDLLLDGCESKQAELSAGAHQSPEDRLLQGRQR